MASVATIPNQAIEGEVMPSGGPPQLSDVVRAGLLELVKKAMGEEKTARRAEVRSAWQGRSFAKGEQHIWWDKTSHMYLSPSAANQELPRYMDAYNLYTPHKRSIENLLAQPTLGINFVPNDLQQGGDVTGASYAEKMRNRVDQAISIKDRQSEATGYGCTDGRTLARTWIDSKGKLRVTMHGVLESKIPLYARRMERWSYASLWEEVDKHEAMEEHSDFADEIDSSGSDTAEGQYERFARLNVISDKRGGDSDALKSVVTEGNVWLRPSRYRKAIGETKDFLETCPEGVRVTVCGGVVVGAVPKLMESELSVEWPSPGQGGSRPSMMADVIPVQIAFNDFVNHQRDQADYIDPVTYIDQQAIESEGIAEQEAAPDNRVPLNLAGKDIRNVVMMMQSSGMSPELSQACTFLMSFAEFVSGDFSALQGEGDPHAETLGGQKLLTNQAKGQLSNAWAALQRLFASVYSTAIRLQATLDQDKGSIAIKGDSGQESFNPSAILEGNWGCYASQDSSFPETMADKRASLQNVLTQIGTVDPTIALHPDNLKLVKQYSGLTDLIIPGAEARDKQLVEIEQMLQEPPVPNEQDPAYPAYVQAMAAWKPQADAERSQQFQQYTQGGGDPSSFQPGPTSQPEPQPPLKSSIDIDLDWDYHQPMLDKTQEWLSSTACAEEIRKGNKAGVQNVKLQGMARKAAIAAQTPPAKIEPPKVSMTMAVTDPTTVAQFAQAAGATTATPQGIAQSQVPDQEETAAKTAHANSQAQHASVLAAKEAIAPAQGFAHQRPVTVINEGAPDKAAQEK